MSLTQRQIEALCHARKQGAFYPEPRSWGRAGGSVHRMVKRLADAGLVERKPPFEITVAGIAAVEGYDDFGRKKTHVRNPSEALGP